MVRNSMNVVWKELMDSGNVCLSAKYRVFARVFGAMYSYGAQVWGFGCLERVDVLLRFFLKRVLGLPRSTPYYVVMLEAGAPLLSLDVLQVNMRYVTRVVFRFGRDRLPRRFAMMELDRRDFWFAEWVRLGQ